MFELFPEKVPLNGLNVEENVNDQAPRSERPSVQLSQSVTIVPVTNADARKPPIGAALRKKSTL
jgi:hypothetical protein